MLVSDLDVVGGERVKVLDFGIAEVGRKNPHDELRGGLGAAGLRKSGVVFLHEVQRRNSASASIKG